MKNKSIVLSYFKIEYPSKTNNPNNWIFIRIKSLISLLRLPSTPGVGQYALFSGKHVMLVQYHDYKHYQNITSRNGTGLIFYFFCWDDLKLLP